MNYALEIPGLGLTAANAAVKLEDSTRDISHRLGHS
jgi:hypothetical protein